MTLGFVGLKNDKQVCVVMEILKELEQEIILLEDAGQAFKKTGADQILIGLFTSPSPKLLRRGNLSRIAAHRVMEYAPSWTKSCQFLIALREVFPQNAGLEEMSQEWIRIIDNFIAADLNKAAPWGPLPATKHGFDLYRQWINNHLDLDPERQGIHFVPPLNNLSRTQIQTIREALKAKRNKRLSDRVISAASKTVHPINLETVIQTGQQLIAVAHEKRLLVESGQGFEKILNALWRAIYREPLLIVAPLCPAWTRNEDGYTFSGIEPEAKGAFYERMAPELDYLVSFLRTLGITYRVLAWVADIEWFNFEETSLPRQRHTKDNFLAIIKRQCQLIQADLEARNIIAETKPLLEILPEESYLTAVRQQRALFEQRLTIFHPTRKYFENTLKAKADFYQRRFGLPVLPSNPHPRIKEALLQDIISHLAPQAMLKEIYSQANLLFFLKSDPFNQLYQDDPYLAWHSSQAGLNL